MFSDTIFSFLTENRHRSRSLQKGEWSDQGERQTPGDGGASYSPVQGKNSISEEEKSACNQT